MPRKLSQMVLPLSEAGSANVLRYHHEVAYGLSDGMGTLEKFPPIGYPMPGNCRRFMPNIGSGKTLCFTCAATTVVGTVTSIHPLVAKPGFEIASPSCPAFADTSILLDDCRVQPSARKGRLEMVERGGACWERLNDAAHRRITSHTRSRTLITGSLKVTTGSTTSADGPASDGISKKLLRNWITRFINSFQ